jgi:hypothetical protein
MLRERLPLEALRQRLRLRRRGLAHVSHQPSR